MNWHKTKTIFIVCFLLLDLFLGYKIYLSAMKNRVSGTVPNDNVQQKDLKVTSSIPTAPDSLNFIKGTQTALVNDNGEVNKEILAKEGSKGDKVQTIEPVNTSEIRGIMKKSITVPKTAADRQSLLRMVYKGSAYQFWKKDTKSNTLLFVQTYQNKPVFIHNKNLNMLTFHIKDDKVVSYEQSFFKFDKLDNSIAIIDATQAVSAIRGKSSDLMIGPHSTINNINLGYFNLVGDINQLIFLPIWEISVKSSGDDPAQRQFFVDASSGEIQTIDATTGGGPQT